MTYNYKTPEEWFSDASARAVTATEKEQENRLKVAEMMREASANSGNPVTKEMIDTEMLLITGRMCRDEFNAYICFKDDCGGWDELED